MRKRAATDPHLVAAAEAALDRKAEGITLLDLRGLSDVTDYFLICHGHSSRQVQAIADSVEEALRSKRKRPGHVEGYARGEWVLMDYFDFVVHIFSSDRRTYYGLERLWADAPRLAPLSAALKRGRTKRARGEEEARIAGPARDEEE